MAAMSPKSPPDLLSISFRHRLDGYLVLQGNIPFRTAQFKKFPKVPARKGLCTRWAEYPFSRCRSFAPTRRRRGSLSLERGVSEKGGPTEIIFV